MRSSAEIKKEIEFYDSLISYVSSGYDKFNNCIDVTNLVLKYNPDELIVNGKLLIDDRHSIKTVANELNISKGIMTQIILECYNIIDVLNEEYYAALEAEKEED